MSRSEAQEWDQRYRNSGHNLASPRAFLLENLNLLPNNGWALDVAMGEGHNANVLVEKGLQVLGVDFSLVALDKAKKFYPGLHLALAHLPVFNLIKECLDVILNFWFLDRALFSRYQRWLKPGGFLMFETMLYDQSDESHARPEFLVQPGELKKFFSGWDFLVYDEEIEAIVKGKPQRAVRMLVRKPGE